MEDITPDAILKMSYVELMAFLEETNRPPGGKDSIRQLVQNCFINDKSKVLDVGCNTGYCSFEISRLAKCKTTGIDISPAMIKTAQKLKERDLLGHLVDFKVADGMKIPSKNNTYDIVMSGGSTAFIEDKIKAISEYTRVLKPWGFLADINFFYKEKPPQSLIRKLNDLMSINIQQWDREYWLDVYSKCGLEKFYIYTNDVKTVSKKEIENYCSAMTADKGLFDTSHKVLTKRLSEIMSLFNENHKYLAYGVFIFRKRPEPEQISLFGA